MAGAGVRVFQPGEVLSASTVNTYLMDQAVCRFATAAARDAAFGGVDQPTLSEGRVCYLDSTNVLQYYSGSSWVSISAEAVSGAIVAKGDVIVGTAATTVGRLPIGTNGQYLVANSSTATGISWEASTIPDGSIINADVNASAAIDLSKLATGTVGAVVVHDASGVPTATALSGDVTVTSSGVTAIGSGVIVNTDINASAAIAYSKLNLGTSIVNADVSTTAAVDLGKLADATIDEKSASYPLVLTDKNKFIKMSVGTANTVTVPTNASVAFPVGSQIHIIQYGSGKTQIIPVSGTVTIYATPGAYLRAQYSSATLLKCDTNIWMLMGDLSAS